MATINLTKVIDKYPHAQNVCDWPVKKISAVFNAADATAAKGSAIATNDVFQMISIPAGAWVLNVIYKVTTVEGGVFTFEVGDGDDTNGYSTATAIDGNTSADAISFINTAANGFDGGKYYTAADTIDLKVLSGVPVKAVVKVTAIYFDTVGASG